MRIAKIRLLNWMRYRGEHELPLEAKAYAVIARGEQNQERSNWLGKSSLLEAIDFAMWGRHRFRTEDEWITNGEKIAEVRIDLDNGGSIIRHRERGKRTTLHYHGPEVSGGAMKEEAQAIIGEIVGLGPDDFLATCYFQQRQMARLILADPSRRMETVSGWLRLGPLERCEEKVRSEASALLDEVQRMEAKLGSLDNFEREALGDKSHTELVDLCQRCDDELDILRGRSARAQDAVIANNRLIEAQTRVLDFESLVREGKALAAEVAKVDGAALRAAHEVARSAEMEAAGVVRAAKAQAMAKGEIARGDFDGTCPVAGIDCPKKEEINQDRKRGLRMYEEARGTLAEAESVYHEAREAEQTARANLQEYERAASRLASMREQAARLQTSLEGLDTGTEPEEPVKLREALDRANSEVEDAISVKKDFQGRLEQLGRYTEQRASISEAVKGLRARLASLREAAVVFGKQGAQRRVAEGALGEIEDGANGMLREAGMDLSVSVQWSREGSGLARACDACGHPFPASARVKVCSRCQAGRGPNLINKLDFELSDRSGAAEDLAGIALQLSAASWLRSERGSMWETALMDEPFGACDAHNRRALGRHLAALLGGRYGFGQAFVVAHSPDVLGALPGRIEIVGGPNGSSVRVIA